MGEETDIVEPIVSEDVVAAEDLTANEPTKDHRRKRKKHLYKSLRDLMEFYLGDINISKDRFISQSILGKPFIYMDLSTFLTFNKVRALTTNIEDLQRALSQSEILQLSEDGTKVCRKTPIMKKENGDDCTIYVEQLGPDMDHDLLSKLFSEFGPVDYVSMPRFFHNGKCKGFAFVEFKDPESAKKSLELFNAKGGCLSPHMAPEELMSIKNYEPNKENKKEEDARETENMQTNYHSDSIESKQMIEVTEDNLNIRSKSEHKDQIETISCHSSMKEEKRHKYREENEEIKRLKSSRSKDIQRKFKNAKDNANEFMKETSDKTEETSDPEIDNHLNNKTDGCKTKNKANNQGFKLMSKEPNVNEIKEIGDVENEDKLNKKKRKRKHSTFETSDQEKPKEPVIKKFKSDNEDLSEEIMEEDEASKQKKKRKKKKKVKKDNSSAISLGLKILPKKEWKQLRNKYLNMQRDMMRSLKQHLSYSKWEKNKSEEKVNKREGLMKPGTVIKVTLENPVSNIKAAKSEMRIHPEIRYIDLTEGKSCVFLRTSTPEIATALVQSKHWPTMEIIQGDEESDYWNKMKADREEHLNKNKHNQRGRTKLLKRAEQFQAKHITTFEAS